ncbi:MAG: ComEC/Rec2 family competence protein [Microthrixaceae bacterium]|nr:ComEC/Rec2 family competence protein [Microthrixaceae bacterium]
MMVGALALSRPSLLVVAAFVLAAGLGHRSLAGLDPPPRSPFTGVVTLVSDPRVQRWGASVDVSVDGDRVELVAAGAAAGAVTSARAGERLAVRGRVGPPPDDAPWLIPRHVRARLSADSVELHDRGAAPWRAANRLRGLVERGARPMGEPIRFLFGGFVLGDRSSIPPAVEDDFQAAGLTHLMVVSGANVAFVLTLASPLTTRLRLFPGWAVTVGIIGAFALLTRFEPSVLRASAMAAVAVTTHASGRQARSVRVLALAVSGLVLVDPLLVRSVGFQLSVMATAGIVVGGGPLARLLPGPASLRQAVAVTIAAQLAVAPLLVSRFGGVPVVAPVANVIAAPAAGAATIWGLPAGVAAGVMGEPWERWLHLPTALAVRWVAGTARIAALAPLGELSTWHLVLVVLAGGAALVGRQRRWPPRARAPLWGVVVLTLLAPAVALRHAPFEVRPTSGVVLYRSGGATVVVVRAGTDPGQAMAGLRRVGVRRIDLVVDDGAGPDVVEALDHRWPLGRIIAPENLDAPLTMTVGELLVHLDSNSTTVLGPESVGRQPVRAPEREGFGATDRVGG